MPRRPVDGSTFNRVAGVLTIVTVVGLVLGWLFLVPADGSWQTPGTVVVMALIVGSVIYDRGRERGRRESRDR